MILLRPNPAQNAAANFISVLMVSGLYITGTYLLFPLETVVAREGFSPIARR